MEETLDIQRMINTTIARMGLKAIKGVERNQISSVRTH